MAEQKQTIVCDACNGTGIITPPNESSPDHRCYKCKGVGKFYASLAALDVIAERTRQIEVGRAHRAAISSKPPR
jgi:DnaJ-class molecular chaperone